MRVALAQINPVLGDFTGNAQKIIEFSKRAREKRADLVVFSELSLFGYPPNDLLERHDLVEEQLIQLKKVIAQIPDGIHVIFGAVILNSKIKKGGKPFQNVAVVARKRKKTLFFAKQLLPSYDIFDESRFFEPGDCTGIFTVPGKGKVVVTVCEDMWTNIKDGKYNVHRLNTMKGIKAVDLAVNISASPFSKTKMEGRLQEACFHAKNLKAPFIYVNQVGAQDELIFDGRSFILDEKGKVMVQGACCDEDLVMIDLETRLHEYRPEEESRTETLRKVLVLGIRDFVEKNGLREVHLGLSGGIDSAVVAALAVDALGPSRVTGLLLPGPHSSAGSVDDGVKLAGLLGIKIHTVNIQETYDVLRKASVPFAPLQPEGAPVSILEQNLQARARGILLMAFSNATGSMLLSTANKSELATGYSTLYGDTNGGLMPLGDLLKFEIYKLAEHYNSARELIPDEILMKAPSAELAPDQIDQDTLPPYPDLDRAVERIVEQKRPAINKTEKWLLKQLAKSEFKRWQSPPILRVSEHGFGRGRRMPIVQKAFGQD